MWLGVRYGKSGAGLLTRIQKYLGPAIGYSLATEVCHISWLLLKDISWLQLLQ
jgi:hypothetical protein